MLTEAHSSDEKRSHGLPIIAIAPTHECISRRKKTKVQKDFSIMPLNYLNPNDWGRSPLTDNALRLQQFKAETQTATKREINSFLCRQHFTLTGTEFLATHETIDQHPYAAAFGQFLGNGIDPDTANILALGSDQFDLISQDFNDPLRQRATRIFRRFEEMGYWDKLPQSSTAEEAEFDEAVGVWRNGEYIPLP